MKKLLNTKVGYILYMLFLGIGGVVTYAIGSVQSQIVFLLISTILLLFNLIEDLNKHILLFMFLACFSLFDMGNFYMHMFDSTDWWTNISGTMTSYRFEEHTIKLSLFVLSLSIFSLMLGYFFSNKFRFVIGTKKKRSDDSESIMIKVRSFIVYIVYFSFAGTCLYNYTKIMAVRLNGYVALYKGFQEIWILTISSLVFKIAFFCYLATMPSRKEAKRFIVLFLISTCVNILSGQRSETVSAICFIIYYSFVRSDEKEQWISKKTIGILAVCSPLIFAGLSIVSALRANMNIDRGIMDYVFRFVGGQGESGLLLSEVIENASDFTYENVNFTFGGILNYIQRVPSLASFFHLQNLQGVGTQTELNAIYGNYFGAAVSYSKIKYTFLSGYSLGTFYIAELFFDYKFMGIIVGNFLLGILINRLTNIHRLSFIEKCIFFAMVMQVLLLGRFTCCSVITIYTSAACLLVYITIFIYYLSKKGIKLG